MNGVPLHPIIVHFPVVLVVLLPLFAIGALWAIRRRGIRPARAWALPFAFAAALTLAAFVAVRTGEAQEERVEEVLASETALHDHEEAAEAFLTLSAVLLLITAAGFVGGAVGGAARLVATVGAVGLIAAGVRVGMSGGDLVYRHGAASAYAGPVAAPGPDTGPTALRGETSEDEDDSH